MTSDSLTNRAVPDTTEDPTAAESKSILEAVEVASSHASHTHDAAPQHTLEKTVSQNNESSIESAHGLTSAQDWTGPDDPGNPLNWSRWKKSMHSQPMAFLSFSVTVGSSLISPSTADISRYFHVSQTAAILPITMYVLGLGLGPVIAAPIAEKFGRTIIYKVSPIIAMLFLVGAGFSKTFGSLLVCRLFAGIAASPVLAVGSGTNADLFMPKERASAMAMYIMTPFLGPAFGPVIGGFTAQFKGWQWSQWCTIFIILITFISCLPMQETYKKVILQKRAEKLGLEPPAASKVQGFAYAKDLVATMLARPIFMLVAEPTVLAFSTYTAFTFSVLFAFFAAYPYTFSTVYGFNDWQSGLAFIGIAIGVVLAAITVIVCDKVFYQRKHREAIEQGRTSVDPEHRLYAAMMGAFGLPIGLFWFAWTARSDISWISPILAGIPFAWGNLSLFLAAAMYLLDVYGPLNGSSAMAANGLLRYALGGCFPLWTVQMYTRLGIGWATSLLGFVTVLLLPIPFVFFWYGPQIRARSRMIKS